MIGVRLAAALVDLAVDGPWGPEAVRPLLRASFVHDVDGDALSPAVLDGLASWTRSLRAVFEAPGPLDRADRINDLLDAGVRRVRLAVHDDLPPHLHFADTEDDLVQRVRALTAGGLAIFAVEAEAGRLGVCARPGCAHVYVDTSKNGRRAYCTATCGNTHAVQRRRAR